MSTEKVAVVTGGGSGIGRTAGMRFAEKGLNVCLIDIDMEKLKKTKQAIDRIGKKKAFIFSW